MFATMNCRVLSLPRPIKNRETGEVRFYVTDVLNGRPGYSQQVYEVLSNEPLKNGVAIADPDEVIQLAVNLRFMPASGDRPARLAVYAAEGEK